MGFSPERITFMTMVGDKQINNNFSSNYEFYTASAYLVNGEANLFAVALLKSKEVHPEKKF